MIQCKTVGKRRGVHVRTVTQRRPAGPESYARSVVDMAWCSTEGVVQPVVLGCQGRSGSMLLLPHAGVTRSAARDKRSDLVFMLDYVSAL